ncbi:MAG TPA: hypothetical protein VFH85_09910 [Gammaproteobacteria bacterium]|nr:hypothetical protein [Gammaproteobacteria bacterium]
MKLTNKAQRRLIPLLILAIGLAPLVAAVVWYFNVDVWRPDVTVNHGRLIKPPRVVHAAPLPLLGGGTLSTDWFQHQWSLVYAGSPDCPARCKKALYMTRQIRLALGAKMNQVQRLFIVAGRPAQPAALRGAHPDLAVADAVGEAGRAFLAQFTHGAELGERIFLVDPRGRLMMVYRVNDDPNGIVADLKRLLKYSRLG